MPEAIGRRVWNRKLERGLDSSSVAELGRVMSKAPNQPEPQLSSLRGH